jgi:hypothetical protein
MTERKSTQRTTTGKPAERRVTQPAKPVPPSPGQADVNVIALRMKIEEDMKHAAKARAFKAAEDRRWDIIKEERARKRRLREERRKR